MKWLIHASLIILALASIGLAQPQKTAQNEARELWLVRAQNLTSDLLKDGADLSNMQRAVLWGKLAQHWWREDPKRARTWILNAIEVVEPVPNKESPEERQIRIGTAQALLAIVTPLDEKLSNRLLTVLSPDKSVEYDGGGTAFALIDAAIRILEDDPKRAAELGAQALRTGRPTNLDPLLYGLRARDPKLADSLFVQALALAKQDRGGMFTNILTYIAFPEQRGRSGNLPVPPDSLRIQLLQILMSLVTDRPASGENSNCGAVTWLAPLFGEFERLLPQQWPILRQAINTCQSASPEIQQRLKYNSSPQLDTVESLLRAAEEAKDLEVRTSYKYRAADLAYENKEYELALKILDDLSTEERELMAESWRSARGGWAADGAVEHYKNGRFREMNLMLDAVPSDLQPLAKAEFIQRLPEQTGSETGPITQILNDAITGLRRSSTPAEEKYNWYFPLIHATVKYQPAEANAVLKDAIASLNQVKDGRPLDQPDYFFGYMGPPLLELDEFVVKDALASLTLVQTRTQLRLSLLAATMQRLKSISRN
ncbi:MAG TPA: hypothetical protein VHS05_31255 [Pyrinomonadaceae bacterium]|jgi:hypothetical protein|nr:hypothetical protein [Pyrinomonadaceae bacterium]